MVRLSSGGSWEHHRDLGGGVRLVTVLVGFALLLSGCSTSSGGSIADWEAGPDQQLSADSQTIDLLVYERECASGQTAEDRIQPPEVAYRDEAVVVTIRVRPKSGGATCQGNPPTPYTLELEEPLGHRDLLKGTGDGAVTPGTSP